MAGIGFVLRQLAKKDNLIGLLKAYFYSALVSTGPWIFTVLAIGSTVAWSLQSSDNDSLQLFRLIIIYNFSFSFVFSGSIFLVATRFLADALHFKDVTGIPGMMFGALALLYASQLPIVMAFYFGYCTLSLDIAFSATINFLLITGIWFAGTFLSAIQDYKTILTTFALGVAVSVSSAVYLVKDFQVFGLLNGFSLGLAVIMFSLLAKVLAEYSYPIKKPFAILEYFKKYWELVLGGAISNIAIWIDKWIMWFAPEAETLKEGLISFPNYDSAMFLAYMTIVPLMACFVFSVETSFYEKYLKFYRAVLNNSPLSLIKERHKELFNVTLKSARNLLILGGSITCIVILTSPKIFEFFRINFLQMGMFRLGVIGAFFQLLNLFLNIFLYYFDCRKKALYLLTTYLLLNGSLTWVSLGMGYEYYGYGYFLSSMIIFVISAFVFIHHIENLIYHTFITANTSVN